VAYFEVNGQRIHHIDSGGDGPPVLFSHGFYMDHQMWDPQVEVLRERYRCITWDERGWGQTPPSGGGFTCWDLASDAVRLLDHLDVENAVWCGMSQGGFLSLRAALAHPDRVKGLVLIDTSPGEEHPETVALYEAMLDQALEHGLDDALIESICAVLFSPGFDASAWKAKMAARPPSLVIDAFACMVRRDGISARLGEITCPTLVLHGELDAAFPVDEAATWASEIPGLVDFVRVPDSGHTANLENPAVVNAALVDFLDGIS
jgi:3-oxoadipate enol-lactonase